MKISRFSQATLFLAASVLLSSCNRGYGCPTNFELNESLVNAVQNVVTFLF